MGSSRTRSSQRSGRASLSKLAAWLSLGSMWGVAAADPTLFAAASMPLAADAAAASCDLGASLGDAELPEEELMSVQLLQHSLSLGRGDNSGEALALGLAGLAASHAGAVAALLQVGANVSGADPVSRGEQLSVNHFAEAVLHQVGANVSGEDSDARREQLSGNHSTDLLLASVNVSGRHQRTSRSLSMRGMVMTVLKMIVVLAVLVLMFTVSCLSVRSAKRPDGEIDDSLRTDCGGCCPCLVGQEVDPSDLEPYEASAAEVFAPCPSWIPFPRDLGPRQWTWRLAEFNLWIQVTVAAYNAYNSYMMPSFMLNELQTAFAILMFIASLPVALFVHARAVGPLLQYFFCSLVTQALYIAAKYSTVSSVYTACGLQQSAFKGCPLRGPLSRCLATSSCMQVDFIGTICTAPGVDTCLIMGKYVPVESSRAWIFIGDAFGVMFFLWGTVPIFMAATAKETRHKEDPSSLTPQPMTM